MLQIAEIPKPVPKENEVLIRIYAATVNRTDCGLRKAEPFIVRFFTGLTHPKNPVLGSELAGVVEETGSAVTMFKKGDEVFGLTGDRMGAHAEYICLPEDASIVTKPSGLSFNEAAAVCDGLMLAYNYLGKVKIGEGNKVLVYGASGSIGTAGVQLAKYLGAEVTAVCNTKNIALVKSLGADRVIDYTKEDFTRHGMTYNVVFDSVGKTSYFKCRKLLKEGGVYFSTDLGFLAQSPLLALVTSIFGNLPGESGKKFLFPLPKDSKKDVTFFKGIIEEGKYKPVIDRCYSFDQIIEAYKYVETGEKTGNVVISLNR